MCSLQALVVYDFSFFFLDSEIIQETRDGNLIRHNLETKKTTILLSNITYVSTLLICLPCKKQH